MDIPAFLDEQVYPALFNALSSAFPEFQWKRHGANWVATLWPADFPIDSTHKRADRLMVYENTKHWIKVHGKNGVRFLDYVNAGQKPVGPAFVEAARKLARLANVPFPANTQSPEEAEKSRQNASRRDALKAVFQYCQQQLHGPHGGAAFRYLIEKRGLPPEAIKDLGLGLYFSFVDVRSLLQEAGFDPQSTDECAGLFVKMQGYITYPWYDAAHQPLTIYGRWPGEPPEGTPKTMALPGEGTKSSPLYFDRARVAGHRDLILVEGVNDAAVLQCSGDARVVACVGAQLSREQVKTLARYQVNSVTICLDPDGGGDAGTLSCISSLSQHGIRAYVAPRLPDGIDPDEYVLKHGIDAWTSHIDKAEHSLRFMAKTLIKRHHADGWTDRSKDECLDDVKDFLRQARPAASYLDIHFWPELAAAISGTAEAIKALCVPAIAPAEVGVRHVRAATIWPKGFDMTDSGLHFSPEQKTDGDVVKPIWVAAPFTVRGECQDGSGGEWGIVLQWSDRAQHEHEWTVPRAMIHGEARLIAQALESKGLRCSTAHQHIKDFLSRLKTPKVLRAVETAGWHRVADNHAYVLADGTVLGPEADAFLLKPESRRPTPECAQSGTLSDWQREVARYAIGNSRLMFFMSGTFAGPLLDLSGEPTGGFHLIGKSQSGKSTATFCAASTWGNPRAKTKSWNATKNGLEGDAKAASDGVLLLDEMGEADDRTIGASVYMIANESGKGRATRSGEARERSSWRLILLSTGEIGLEAKMNEANKKAATGLRVRLVDIPADAGAGLGVFQHLHEHANAAALATHLRKASGQFYGVAIRRFLSRLAEERDLIADDLRKLIQGFRDEFVRDHVPSYADGQVLSVAGRFSLVAAAGELASAFGITGWPVNVAKDAAGECFRVWLLGRGHSGAGEDEQAVAAVTAYIVQHGSSRFEDVSGIDPSNGSGTSFTTYQRVGWRVDGSTKYGCDYAIHPAMWKAEVCKGIDSIRAAHVLRDRGLLVKPENGRLTSKVPIPGHGRPRLYVVSGSILGRDDPGDGGETLS